jgi:exonuclease SbcC
MNQDIGANEARIEQLHRDIARANDLREKEKEHHRMATLARDLASLLRADRLPAFIREQELRALARDGSERLKEISDGRYDFQVEGQDFVIVDHWNIGETRSVRTLSGGETFLASLALALALADRLPGLMSGVEGSSLESLFIDEGFSHLDDETLDTVASALEVLGQDRRRLIGVITHLSALADRMPARIVVNKRRTGSTVTVE